MKIVHKKLLHDFSMKHSDAKNQIDSWFAEAKVSVWKTTMDIKEKYPSASFLGDNIVIFNIKGNNYRLVVKVAYKTGNVTVKWVGTHAEYDKMRFS